VALQQLPFDNNDLVPIYGIVPYSHSAVSKPGTEDSDCLTDNFSPQELRSVSTTNSSVSDCGTVKEIPVLDKNGKENTGLLRRIGNGAVKFVLRFFFIA
jgi:hypothetical protein